jgi:hypothetical protein
MIILKFKSWNFIGKLGASHLSNTLKTLSKCPLNNLEIDLGYYNKYI